MASMILIEGNIGCGKSTLTRMLSQRYDWVPMYEPVETNPYLEDFYSDPYRWGLEMQYFLMSHRFRLHQDAIDRIWRHGKTVVMDRSIYGDAVFCERNHLDGKIDERGYKSYMAMRDVMFRFLMVPHVCLYLRAKPEICNERIAGRGRGCEKEIPLQYLRGLDQCYESLLCEFRRMGTEVVELDWNQFQDIDYVESRLRKVLPKEFERYPAIR